MRCIKLRRYLIMRINEQEVSSNVQDDIIIVICANL